MLTVIHRITHTATHKTTHMATKRITRMAMKAQTITPKLTTKPMLMPREPTGAPITTLTHTASIATTTIPTKMLMHTTRITLMLTTMLT